MRPSSLIKLSAASGAALLNGMLSYAVILLIVAPVLIQRAMETYARQELGRTFRTEALRVHPFTWDLELTDLHLDDADGSRLAAAARVRADLELSSLLRRTIVIRALDVERARGVLVRFAAGDSNFSRLLADVAAAPGRDVRIAHLYLHGGSLELVDDARTPAVRARLQGVEFTMADLATDRDVLARYTLTARGPEGATLDAIGWMRPAAAALRATVRLDGVDIGGLEPYLRGVTTLAVRSGLLAAELEVRHEEGELEVLGGRLEVRDVRLAGADFGEPGLKLSRLAADGVRFQAAPARLSVATAVLSDPHVRLQIDSEGRANVATWFEPLLVRDQGAARRAGVRLGIDRVDIAGGRLDLADFSLSPPLQLTAEELRGALRGPRRTGDRRTSLELEGRIGDVGSMRISARLQPFDLDRHTAIDLRIRGLDTATLSPYAARLAGWTIAAGRVDLSLAYRLRDGRVDADQAIALEDLLLGERVDRAGTPALPLDLAAALLSDRTGRIELSVPVAGRLDDGDFDLRTATANAIRDRITRVTGAPFEALAALAGEDGKALSTVAFDPGRAAITATAGATLDALSEALKQRPVLGLLATGGYHPHLDREALARQQLRLQISLAAAGGAPVDPRDPGPLDLADPRIQEVLDEFARARLGQGKLQDVAARFADEQAPADESAPADGDRADYYAALLEALVGNETIAQADLERLARYRAQAVADQLEGLGLAPGRVEPADEVRRASTGERLVVLELRVGPLRREAPARGNGSDPFAAPAPSAVR